jgi:CRP/FNR family cyclic AMP-dependent transcriptional regulator
MLQCEEAITEASTATKKEVARPTALEARRKWAVEHPFFGELRGNELDRVAALLKPRMKEKGDYLYALGDTAETLFFIRSGRVKLNNHAKDGREVIKEVLTARDTVGEAALLGHTQRTEHAVAMAPTCLYTLPLADVHSLMDGNTDFALGAMRFAADRLLRTARRMENLVLHDARTRLLRLIMDMAEQQGRTLVGGSVVVEHGLTHFDMGGLTAISRQTVTTILNELREEGLINFDRRTVLIHDPKKLLV